jgi:molybdenum cofactor synthesis domain-containing protein
MTGAHKTAAVLIIGNEILSGRTPDANLAHIAGVLDGLGIRVREARVVADEEGEILAALDALRHRYDYVFTTGGIGPTHDDITAACIAKAFGVALVQDEAAVERMAAALGRENLTPARLRMTYVPAGARLIDNPATVAPGFHIGNVYVLAGVPSIMRAMLAGLVSQLEGGVALSTRTVMCNVPESRMADSLAALQLKYPTVEIGSYPAFRDGKAAVSFVLRALDTALLDAATEEAAAIVRVNGGEPRVIQGFG